MAQQEVNGIMSFIAQEAQERADEYEVARGVVLSTVSLLGNERSIPVPDLADFVSRVSGVDYATTQLAIVVSQDNGVIVPGFGNVAGLGQSKDEALNTSQIDPVTIGHEKFVTREVLGDLLEEQIAINAATGILHHRFRLLHE